MKIQNMMIIRCKESTIVRVNIQCDDDLTRAVAQNGFLIRESHDDMYVSNIRCSALFIQNIFTVNPSVAWGFTVKF